MEESEIMLDEEEQEILKELKRQGKKKQKDNKQSEMQKLENMIQDQEEQIDNKFLLLPDTHNEGRGGNVNTENSQQMTPLDQTQNSPLRESNLQYNSPINNNVQNNIKIIENLEDVSSNLLSSPGQESTPSDNQLLSSLYAQ